MTIAPPTRSQMNTHQHVAKGIATSQSTTIQEHDTPPPPPDESEARVRVIYDLVGKDAILLCCPVGEKGPRDTGWKTTTLESSNTSEYQQRLAKSNIAVLLGRPSRNLCAIDLDDDAAAEEFIQLNPKLQSTLTTRGARGCQVWVRPTGGYPEKIHKILDSGGSDIGEWRGDGCSMISGQHPDGMQYKYVTEASVLDVDFEKILWPDEWICEWKSSPYQRLVDDAGEPFRVGARGGVSLNQHFFCKKYALENYIFFEPGPDRFYQYGAATGLWKPLTEARLKNALQKDIKEFAKTQKEVEQAICHAANHRFLAEVLQLLKGETERRIAPLAAPPCIHVGNGMVLPCYDTVYLQPFAPGHYSRNQCPIEYVAEAKCPRFLELLQAVLPADDICLMQRMFGYVLRPGNPVHKIFLLTGPSATSKSTIAAILEQLVGFANAAQLRTQHLGSRFELGGYVGKTLLTGKDVPEDFLRGKDAEALKSMVGGDRLDAELKNANERVGVPGTFQIAITSNHRLTLRPSGRNDAWRRRLIAFEFGEPFLGKRIPNFEAQLIRAEGRGILAWAIQGLLQVEQEIDETGDFILTEQQKERVDRIVAESDSLRGFLTARVTAGSGDLATEEIINAYLIMCAELQWRADSRDEVAKRLPSLMDELFSVGKSHSLKRDRRDVRGFRGVAWRSARA